MSDDDDTFDGDAFDEKTAIRRVLAAIVAGGGEDSLSLIAEFDDDTGLVELARAAVSLADFLLSFIADLCDEPREKVGRDLLLVMAGGYPTGGGAEPD